MNDVSGEGTLRLDLIDNDTIRDILTNPNCNILVCNGSVPTKGLIQNVQSLTGLL